MFVWKIKNYVRNHVFFGKLKIMLDGVKVENPPAEVTPDFAYKPCKGFQAAVIEESQKDEETGLALCTFPVPSNRICSRGPRTPILAGTDAGQPCCLL